MKYWIVPQNNDFFRLDDLLKVRNTVTWRHRNNFQVGDIVFMYTSSPIRRINYVMIVEQINVPSIDDSEFWGDKYVESNKNAPYCSLFKLQQILSTDLKLTFYDLKQHGLTSNLQGVISVDGKLLDYIKSEIGNEITLESSPEFLEKDISYPEGATMQVTINKYERNRDARMKCIAVHGYTCKVCGIDFEKTYGKLGKGFIHVHHIVPLATIGKIYEIDPVNDLVPVCPNCHAMLHRLGNDNVLTIEELRSKLK
ncbi:MAG: EVE domain-containing protein [Muribaculaceae bacterium]|nr:EVE domain-containing protein [Muribaculaceae bacterium]